MYIGIDLGTTNCKAAVFDGEMHMLSCVGTGYPLIVHSAAEIEQDANVWWDCVLRAMDEALEQANTDRKAIEAVSVSAQGISIVPMDRDGRTLFNAISWLDMRAEEEEREILRRFSANEIFQKTGKRVSRIYSLPKLMWLKKHLPDVYAAADKILFPMDFILFRLCGRAITDPTIAAGSMLYNVQSRCWDEELVRAFDLDMHLLPEVGCAGDFAANLLPEVADRLGLSHNVRVAIGGQDQKCAALGAGIGDGIITVSLGTGSCISALSKHALLDDEMRIPCFSYLDANQWVLEGVLSTGAACYDWFRKNFCPYMSFEELNNLAGSTAAPAAERFYPNLSGASSPDWSDASGALAGLTMNSNLGSMARSVLEGVAYGIRENIEVMRTLGVYVDRLRVFGGGAKSPLWLQIISNVTALPVDAFSSGETALRGAGILSLKATGRERCPDVHVDHTFVPDRELAGKYDAAYAEYQRK